MTLTIINFHESIRLVLTYKMSFLYIKFLFILKTVSLLLGTSREQGRIYKKSSFIGINKLLITIKT